MLIGVFFIAAGLIVFFEVTTGLSVLSNLLGSSYGIYVALFILTTFSVSMMMGYIKPATITVVKNTSNTGFHVRILGVIPLIIAIGLYLSLQEPLSDIPKTMPTNDLKVPTAKFVSIKDGEKVKPLIPLVVSGKHQNIPEEEYSLWIVAMYGSNCYPMDGPVRLEPTGVWRHNKVIFPSQTKSYLLSLFLANSDASSRLDRAVETQAGLPCSNVNANESDKILNTISVTIQK